MQTDTANKGQINLIKHLMYLLEWSVETKKANTLEFTKRTNDIEQLTATEATSFIKVLEEMKSQFLQKKQKRKRQVIANIYKMPESFGWWYYDVTGKKKFAGRKFDEYLLTAPKSPFKGKKFNNLTYVQLGKLIALLLKWDKHYNKK